MPEIANTQFPAVVAIETRKKSCHSPTLSTIQVRPGLAAAGVHRTTLSAQSWQGKPKYEHPVALGNPRKQAVGKGRLVLAYGLAYGA